MEIKEILKAYKNDEISIDETIENIDKASYSQVFTIKLDNDRESRKGYPETIYCEGKSVDQLIEIFNHYKELDENVLGTRCSEDQYQDLSKVIADLIYDPVSKVIKLEEDYNEKIGNVAVCTGGSSDMPVAEEAAQVAEYLGSNVSRFYDVGVAGLHRLLAQIDEIKKANVIIAIAGMEGALASVIAGLVDIPVIALPTSVGYGASFDGLAALLAMLNSCAEGVTVVNIDNGFGAAYSANQINRMVESNG